MPSKRNSLTKSQDSATKETTPLLHSGTHGREYSARHGDSTSSANTGSPALNGKHCHEQGHKVDGLDKRARRKLLTASILCLLFMVGEIVGGVLANSLAIATDAAHLLTDFASFMISLFSVYLASRPATKRMSFGWYRAEVMGALVSVLLIWVVTGVLVFMAVERVISGKYEINATVMLITAGIGVFVNILMGLTLHDHGHGHSHGGTPNTQYQANEAQFHQTSENHSDQTNVAIATGASASASLTKESSLVGSGDSAASVIIATGGTNELSSSSHSRVNINVRAAFIHVIGDFLQSLGVLVAAFIIYFKPKWKIADPICTFLFSVLVLITTINILKDALLVLMEGTPRDINFNEVTQTLCSIPGVKELHDLRLWSLTMSKSALSVHLALDEVADSQQVVSSARDLMRQRFGIYECTVQTEGFVDNMMDCTMCQEPKD